jgi:hypothetical protein
LRKDIVEHNLHSKPVVNRDALAAGASFTARPHALTEARLLA